MADLTYVARVSDGMILVASMGMHGNNVFKGAPVERWKHQAKAIMKKLGHSVRSRCATIAAGGCSFHYAVSDGIVYLCLTPKVYPKRLAHHYLEQIRDKFVAHLQKQHGGDWQRQVATVARRTLRCMHLLPGTVRVLIIALNAPRSPRDFRRGRTRSSSSTRSFPACGRNSRTRTRATT